MDGFREHPSEFEPVDDGSDAAATHDVAAAIGTDERRMHVRAYNYWVSLLDGRDFPSIEDLEPADVSDFADHSVLLDFTCGRDNPAIPYIGAAIRDECGLAEDTRTIGDVPSRSLLSRLTDHYMQIIANRAPVGFEAEFENQREETICYRGILMPFSSDGDGIDFIYGVINWKKDGEAPVVEEEGTTPTSAGQEEPAIIEIARVAEEAEAEAEQAFEPETLAQEPEFETEPAITDEPIEPLELTDFVQAPIVHEEAAETSLESSPELQDERATTEPPVHFSWEDGPLHDEDEVPVVQLDEDAGLADRLWAARETAESVKAGEGRTRSALYKALSLAYDFALAAQENPQEYAELLEESGVKAQARAPMTPIVKLVFGIDYDKARLTEFAAALSYAQRQQIGAGGFQELIEKHAGGLKALVAAE